MAKHDVNFNERLQTAAKARQATLAHAKANAPINTPGYVERQAKRVAASIARDKRREEALVQRLAKATRAAEEKAAMALAKQRAIESEKAEQEEALEQEAIQATALKAKQKAARDAKYTARKARRS